jgi:hypothetical protein
MTRRTLLAGTGAAMAVAAGGAAYLFAGANPAGASGTVVKSPLCGCCNAWVTHMAEAGLALTVENTSDVEPFKREHGVPAHMVSCHTAVIDGYVIEGHVPAAQVHRLLAERPAIRGLAVPGMPEGSPGMEGPNPEAYTVYALLTDDRTRPFARIRP